MIAIIGIPINIPKLTAYKANKEKKKREREREKTRLAFYYPLPSKRC